MQTINCCSVLFSLLRSIAIVKRSKETVHLLLFGDVSRAVGWRVARKCGRVELRGIGKVDLHHSGEGNRANHFIELL